MAYSAKKAKDKNMTEITYSNIPIDLAALEDYVKSIQACKKLESYKEWKETHAVGIAESIVISIAEDCVSFDSKDQKSCFILEQLIREVGYDENGHYTDTAKTALKNLYNKRGLDPNLVELHDIQVKKSWLQRFKFRNKEKSTSNKKSSFWNPVKNFWNKHKKFILGAAIFGGCIVSLKSTVSDFFKTSKSPVSKEIKVSPDSQAISSDIFVWQPQSLATQQILTPDSFVKSRLDTIKEIEANKKAYRQQIATQTSKSDTVANQPYIQTLSHNDSIRNEPYISSLELHHAEHLIKTVENQLAKGIFKAEKGLTKERIAHAYLMCQIYAQYDRDGTKIVLDAVNSQKRLTPSQQTAFTNYILYGVGEGGIKLQTLSIKKGNKNRNSAFNRASKQQQQRHIKTLQDVRRINGR